MTVREQAEYYRVLLAMGLVRREDVIAWADRVVLESAGPPEVIDVSLATHKPDHEVDALLQAVRGAGDLAAAAHAALHRLKPTLRDRPLKDAVKVVVAYGRAARVSDGEYFDAVLFEVLYDEMTEGYCGTEAEVWDALKAFVERYTAPYGKGQSPVR